MPVLVSYTVINLHITLTSLNTTQYKMCFDERIRSMAYESTEVKNVMATTSSADCYNNDNFFPPKHGNMHENMEGE